MHVFGIIAFSGLSNYFDGTAYAVVHDVVFVSLNYRVGAFGKNSSFDVKFSVSELTISLINNTSSAREKFILFFFEQPPYSLNSEDVR